MHELQCQMLLELGFAMDEPTKINSTDAAEFLELRHWCACLWKYLMGVVVVCFMVSQNKPTFEVIDRLVKIYPPFLYFMHFNYNSNK